MSLIDTGGALAFFVVTLALGVISKRLCAQVRLGAAAGGGARALPRAICMRSACSQEVWHGITSQGRLGAANSRMPSICAVHATARAACAAGGREHGDDP